MWCMSDSSVLKTHVVYMLSQHNSAFYFALPQRIFGGNFTFSIAFFCPQAKKWHSRRNPQLYIRVLKIMRSYYFALPQRIFGGNFTFSIALLCPEVKKWHYGRNPQLLVQISKLTMYKCSFNKMKHSSLLAKENFRQQIYIQHCVLLLSGKRNCTLGRISQI